MVGLNFTFLLPFLTIHRVTKTKERYFVPDDIFYLPQANTHVTPNIRFTFVYMYYVIGMHDTGQDYKSLSS